MDYRQLEAFAAVMSVGSITGADQVVAVAGLLSDQVQRQQAQAARFEHAFTAPGLVVFAVVRRPMATRPGASAKVVAVRMAWRVGMVVRCKVMVVMMGRHELQSLVCLRCV